VDLAAGGRGDLENLPGALSSSSCLARPAVVGVDAATSRPARPGARRSRHRPLGAGALAAGKKNAQALNAWLVFVDESAFSQRPPIRATWAPRGRTPVVVEPFNWRRLSGIGAVLTDATATRLRWLLSLHRGNIRSAQLVRFLQALRRHRRRPVILLWDRLPAHRSRCVAAAVEQHCAWLQVEWLPAYAPELNPVEPFWDYLDDTALANTPMEDLGRLRGRLRSGRERLDRRTAVGRGLLRYTGLF